VYLEVEWNFDEAEIYVEGILESDTSSFSITESDFRPRLLELSRTRKHGVRRRIKKMNKYKVIYWVGKERGVTFWTTANYALLALQLCQVNEYPAILTTMEDVTLLTT